MPHRLHYRWLLCLIVALTIGRPDPATAQDYDLTRAWTQCTRGSANACARMLVRTTSLDDGGTRVAIGLTNLQGSPFDNLTGSLLANASFDMALNAGTSSYLGTVAGTAAGGAQAPDRGWQLLADAGVIRLAAPEESMVTTSTYTLFNNRYWGTASTVSGLGYESWYTYDESRTTTNSVYGIAGANTSASHSQTSTSFHGAPVTRGSWYSHRHCGTWSCYTEYHGYSYSATANVPDYTVNQRLAGGSTADEESIVWFTFESANRYDVRQFASASFGVYDTATGQALRCSGSDELGCEVRSDMLIDHASTTTPEPVTMGLLGTGLLGVAAARRRKRQTQA